jgi:hypothetical protein
MKNSFLFTASCLAFAASCIYFVQLAPVWLFIAIVFLYRIMKASINKQANKAAITAPPTDNEMFIKIYDLATPLYHPQLVEICRNQCSYLDRTNDEHLFSPELILEYSQDKPWIEPMTRMQIQTLVEFQTKLDCSYFRFVD